MGAKPYILELDQIGRSISVLNPLFSTASVPKKRMPADLGVHDVDDGAALTDALDEMTHQRTFPNTFINHKHIGGNSDLQAKMSELPSLLKEAGAV